MGSAALPITREWSDEIDEQLRFVARQHDHKNARMRRSIALDLETEIYVTGAERVSTTDDVWCPVKEAGRNHAHLVVRVPLFVGYAWFRMRSLVRGIKKRVVR